jgi:hypothetical protein
MAEVQGMSSRQRWTLVLVCTAAFMLLLDITIVSVALPSIQRDLGASLPDLQWVSAAYALVLAVLLLPAATLGDRLGRRRLFLVGLVIFTGGSLACALAWTALALELFRALQGVGGAVLFATATPLLRAEFSGGHYRHPARPGGSARPGRRRRQAGHRRWLRGRHPGSHRGPARRPRRGHPRRSRRHRRRAQRRPARRGRVRRARSDSWLRLWTRPRQAAAAPHRPQRAVRPLRPLPAPGAATGRARKQRHHSLIKALMGLDTPARAIGPGAAARERRQPRGDPVRRAGDRDGRSAGAAADRRPGEAGPGGRGVPSSPFTARSSIERSWFMERP